MNQTLNFGNFLPVGLSGTVYNDLDGSGTIAPDDPLLQGWTINLENSSGTIIATETSGADGSYDFDGVLPGTYTIDEVPQTGWYQTQPVNPSYYTITTQSGDDVTGLNFGNFQTVTVSGIVYNDLTGSGTYVPGDPLLAGWTINLEDVDGHDHRHEHQRFRRQLSVHRRNAR